MNQFGLVQAIDRFSQCIVVAVAAAADGWFDAGFGQSLAVSNADVLGDFNRSLQHLLKEVSNGTTTGLGFGTDGKTDNAIAWQAWCQSARDKQKERRRQLPTDNPNGATTMLP
ncbi:hypothetical protein OKW41_004628 [Paraburkholderia sp. UCT70]